MMEALGSLGPLLVYALTAVAAVATIRASTVTQKERMDEHLEQDRETHTRLFGGLEKVSVGVARLEEKVDHLRSDIQRQQRP